MKMVIIAFGAFIIAMAGLLVLRPRAFARWMVAQAEQTWLYAAAVIVRFALGAVLLAYADQSRFPLVLEVLGWIALGAALALLLMQRSRFHRFVQWAFDRFGKFTRTAGLFAVLFGAFLIYAVV